jgi:hypothetical protein
MEKNLGVGYYGTGDPTSLELMGERVSKAKVKKTLADRKEAGNG